MKQDIGKQGAQRLGLIGLEIAMIVLVCFLFAGSPPPGVNEAHYLAKAKQYWEPSWCPGDPFLESADAHLVFYWSFGWLTKLFSLTTCAWIGRFLTWALLAWAWRRLSWTIWPKQWMGLIFGKKLVIPPRCRRNFADETVPRSASMLEYGTSIDIASE